MLNSLFGRVLILIAAVIFCLLQSKLWMGDGGFLDIQELKSQIATQQAENEKLAERNQILKAEVNDLKSGTEAIEEHARLDLGLVKTDETFILVTANKQPVVSTPPAVERATP
ncbi:MAG TPA: cell division protein FtsB [Agitococcus sp.]|nr:cell division protein FtsB [Agitococcus sp.]